MKKSADLAGAPSGPGESVVRDSPGSLTGEEINAQWMHWMRRGEYERAWRVSDCVTERRVPPASALAGLRVLIRCQHGLGDTIQFIRYARLLRTLVSKTMVHCQPCLVPLVRSMPEIDFVFTWDDPWPHGSYDLEIEVMDLPHSFRTTVETVPACVPYLRIDPECVRAKRSLFRREGRFHIGLVWAASIWDEKRSIPLSSLSPLGAIRDIAVFSLQHGPESRQCVGWIQNPGEPENDNVVETAAAILNLDLVITVDTMVAHLAGALGKPVWVLLRHEADWRWMQDREDSPWYPSMRLFRQDATRDWTAVLERVCAEIRGRTSPQGACYLPNNTT